MSKNRLGMEAINLSFSQIITMVISMITAMLLSRYRTLEEYGTYSQLLMSANIISTLTFLGLPNSINYFLAHAETKEEKTRFLNVYYTLVTVLSIITGIILVLSIRLISQYFNNDLIITFSYFLMIYPWITILKGSVTRVLIVYEKTRKLLIFQTTNSVFVLFSIIFTQISNGSFQDYMKLFILVETLFTIISYIMIKKLTISFRFTISIELIKKIYVYSLPIGFASVVGILNTQIDKLFIARLFSVEDLAIYTNAAKELPIIFVASSLSAIILPKVIRLIKGNQVQNAVNLWSESIILSYVIISFLTIGIFVFSEDVIILLYSEKYLPGVEVFRVYLLVLLMRFTYFGLFLSAIGKTKFILYSSFGTLFLNVVLNFIFYNLFGYIGPAIATFISILAMQIFQLVITSKQFQISILSIFPWKKMFFITLVNFLLGLFFWVMKYEIKIKLTGSGLLDSIILAIFWGIVYLPFVYKYIVGSWKQLSKY